MFICDKCGKKVKELALYTQYEQLGDMRVPTMEYELDTCGCGGEYKEATKCPICHEYFLEDEIGCCTECFEKNLTKENCLKAGENLYEVNDFLAFVFSQTEIEELLEREFDKLEDSFKKHFIREYATQNSSHGEDSFIRKIIERNRYDNIHKRKDNG